MDWSYFLDDGKRFRAKRLPSGKGCSVKIKDVSDLYSLRDYLKDCETLAEAIEAYEEVFDHPDV